MYQRYRLRSWVTFMDNNESWHTLSCNPKAIDFLEQNIDKIDWSGLSSNPNAIHLLQREPDKIDWMRLSYNENGMDLMQKYYDTVDTKVLSREVGFERWQYLSRNENPSAIRVLERNQDLISWGLLSLNAAAVHLLEKNVAKLDWSMVSQNPNAINLLEANHDKIDWYMLSSNTSAFNLFESNKDKLNWHILSGNINAISLLERNIDKINWHILSSNPSAIHILESGTGTINQNTFRCFTILQSCSILRFEYFLRVFLPMEKFALSCKTPVPCGACIAHGLLDGRTAAARDTQHLANFANHISIMLLFLWGTSQHAKQQSNSGTPCFIVTPHFHVREILGRQCPGNSSGGIREFKSEPHQTRLFPDFLNHLHGD